MKRNLLCTVQLAAEEAEILYHLTFDKLSNVIRDAHTAGERTKMIKKRYRKFKDVTVESLIK